MNKEEFIKRVNTDDSTKGHWALHDAVPTFLDHIIGDKEEIVAEYHHWKAASGQEDYIFTSFVITDHRLIGFKYNDDAFYYSAVPSETIVAIEEDINCSHYTSEFDKDYSRYKGASDKKVKENQLYNCPIKFKIHFNKDWEFGKTLELPLLNDTVIDELSQKELLLDFIKGINSVI